MRRVLGLKLLIISARYLSEKLFTKLKYWWKYYVELDHYVNAFRITWIFTLPPEAFFFTRRQRRGEISHLFRYSEVKVAESVFPVLFLIVSYMKRPLYNASFIVNDGVNISPNPYKIQRYYYLISLICCISRHAKDKKKK